jgi:hypothetical protein
MPTPKLLPNQRKLLKEHFRRIALQKANNVRYAYFWLSRNKDVQMTTIMNPSSQQSKAMIGSNHLKYFQQPNLN